MAVITIKTLGNHTFLVTVGAKTSTEHTVTVHPEYVQQLTLGKASDETLLEKSFEFLLARESNTSILRSFDLSVIARYFPEYERTISHMF